MATSADHTMADKQNEKNFESLIIKSFLNLEKIEVDLFRSRTLWQNQGFRAVFGGQVVGQALAAACYSVPEDHHTHSLHCYFLRPGNAKTPILYSVDRTRDGNVYSSRSVKAVQEGQAILTMQASYKTGETDPFQHQVTMPKVPSPDQCPDALDLLSKATGSNEKAEEYMREFREQMATLYRPVLTEEYKGGPLPAKRCVWIKTDGFLGDDYKEHQCCVAYMSDSFLLGTCLLPHDSAYPKSRNFFMTSLDHSLWFHSEFRADDWLLYEMESPVCSTGHGCKKVSFENHGLCRFSVVCSPIPVSPQRLDKEPGEGRGFASGRLWTQDGRLAVSVAQEGVIRTRKPKSELTKSSKL